MPSTFVSPDGGLQMKMVAVVWPFRIDEDLPSICNSWDDLARAVGNSLVDAANDDRVQTITFRASAQSPEFECSGKNGRLTDVDLGAPPPHLAKRTFCGLLHQFSARSTFTTYLRLVHLHLKGRLFGELRIPGVNVVYAVEFSEWAVVFTKHPSPEFVSSGGAPV